MKHSIIASIILLVVCACSRPADPRPSFYQEIKSADKMVFSSMAITKTAKMEDNNMFGKRIAVYSYDTYMRAYIDLSALQPDDIVIDEDNKNVKVMLPPVETEVVGRDMEMRKEYDNIGTLRSRPDSKERADIKEKANSSFKTEIEDNPTFKHQLTETAERKARRYFETLFEENGYTASVDFKSSK